MPSFDGLTTSEEVLEAFGSQIKDRTFVITGAGKPSIGEQIVSYLAQGSPAHIIIASRTERKVTPVLEAIKAIDSSIKTTFVHIDLSDQDSVRHAAAEILAVAPKIDVLINCAGVMVVKEYTTSKQGIELQLATNHIGHFLLTNLLVPALEAAAPSRVVNLSSSGYRISHFHFDDWNFSDGKTYDGWTGYAQSKTANILFAIGFTNRIKHRGITSTALHPGYNLETELGTHLGPDDYALIDPVIKRNTGNEFVFEEPRFKSLSQIAATALIASLDPELPEKSPAFLQNSRIDTPDPHATDPEAVEKLWKLSEEIVGQKFEY
ncbi:short-chain dehydrogenase [Aspergillus steynii IBT 23096]|uniref:Short-chain dehydrogenase n=1 Tax=Aspergillus steynii IBT 23096 TaxID=1392250 RepID=A0A2I2G0R9_9EURO|nr:short-chain dehydrogenase [Aspergillus steynii IBT 23096]PLB46463.1 short-chain dehydrogenase [Aspergillus steynii IBT 23096]